MFLNIMNTYSHLLDKTNEHINSVIIFIAPLAIVFIMTFLVNCNRNNKIVVEDEVEPVISQDTSDEEDDDDETYEENSEDEEDDEDSEDEEEDDEDNNEKYSSVIQKAFTLLTKKQLISITGKKYKNKNKDELVVIALYKFMLTSIIKSEKLPKGIKQFIEANKIMLKTELLELYEIDA